MATLAKSKDVSNTQSEILENIVSTESIVVTTESVDSSEFTRKNLIALGNRIRITDRDEDTGLELLCYVNLQCIRPRDSPQMSRCSI